MIACPTHARHHVKTRSPARLKHAPAPSPEELDAFATSGVDERGAVFTRREVVDFILDLSGYTRTTDLTRSRLLEPAAGHGDFLLPAIERLVGSYVSHGGTLEKAPKALRSSILAFEVHGESLAAARKAVGLKLMTLGLPQRSATSLASAWVVAGDFLLAEVPGHFTHVVGNPPYVRQELIPESLLRSYRHRYRTMYDRADLYVPFFERSLELLAPGGKLGFICTDRWTKNKYGGPLRALVAQDYALTHYVDLVGCPAFLADVMTYPAITVIEKPVERNAERATRVVLRPSLDPRTLTRLAREMTARALPARSMAVSLPDVVQGSEPWIVHDPARLDLVRRLEAHLPSLEEAGCKVGIGVATGNDRVYIAPFDALNVEPSRKLPLVRTQDFQGTEAHWGGMGVLNPFEDDGAVVDLRDYPKFAAYLRRHAEAIRARNVAKRNPDRWFRTIDRIYPSLARQPKLLIPDIKGDAHVIYEGGELYPHHNLYYITSADWDLRALQAVLMSGIARLFVATYSTSMRGGFLRFQAQYLRRIRVPSWSQVPKRLRTALRRAALTGDQNAANLATFELFGLSGVERALVATV